ncbi:Methyltransferase-like protein 7A-like 1 [Homarus americanus]|uniref:Methyltransferase-like protein 7A-like 1 n=2 Tax=Homarus americanus TaxID=6706 RepID=A0A8J5NAJ3_HOMAM|nr:Methyltransferase-like protein 7A-like 1 [Homarus americanus]
MSRLTKEKDAKLEEVKKDLFASLGAIVSHDPQLRKNKAIKILEVGVGTGVNFSHYPNGSHLTVVDPNPHFVKYYNDNRKKFPNIHSQDIIVTTGEEMDQVESNSVDVVVMTLVLCSVGHTDKILQQILRVLVPGGKFYFLEHIREFDSEKYGIRQKLQDFLTETGIWPLLFDGCCLNRDMLSAINEAGFSSVIGERFYAPISNFFFKIIQPQLKGVAEK